MVTMFPCGLLARWAPFDDHVPLWPARPRGRTSMPATPAGVLRSPSAFGSTYFVTMQMFHGGEKVRVLQLKRTFRIASPAGGAEDMEGPGGEFSRALLHNGSTCGLRWPTTFFLSLPRRGGMYRYLEAADPRFVAARPLASHGLSSFPSFFAIQANYVNMAPRKGNRFRRICR